MIKVVNKNKRAFGTQEWASKTANFINGCGHDCKYCYAKSIAVRFKRKTPDSWRTEEVNHIKLKAHFRKNPGYIMFPSSHDISPENLNYSLQFMDHLLVSGNRILVVTKPHLSVIEAIVNRFNAKKDSILFRFTIGSSNSETLKFWEPNAPSFEERLESLRFAYYEGFKTSISCEPALDTNTAELVEILLPFVTDAIWIGLPNRLKVSLKLNGADDPETLERAGDLIKEQSEDWVMELYDKYRDNPKIKWKEGIKKLVGIERPTMSGLDI